MKNLLVLIGVLLTLNCFSQDHTINPGNWKFKSNLLYHQTDEGLDGEGLIKETGVRYEITCDTAKTTIYFAHYDPEDKKWDTVRVRYGRIETNMEKQDGMEKGVYYYRTWGGTVEYHPMEMVLRVYPGRYRYEYNNKH